MNQIQRRLGSTHDSNNPKTTLAAGFRFVGESKLLANPADDHSKLVFDKAIRGHTDQFIYKFRKPR